MINGKLMGAMLVLCLMLAGEARAQTGVSANELLEGCRAIESGNLLSSGSLLLDGRCAGNIEGVWTMPIIAGWVCAPKTAIMRQATKVVIQYIDARPARMHEQFDTLALEALVAAWPCVR